MNQIKKYYILKDFKFTSGKKLNNLKVEYIINGTPIKNEKGEIINAIVFAHSWNQNCSEVKHLKKIVGKGKVLDTDKYFIVSITTLGTSGSSAPLNDEYFPKYNIDDMVNFQIQFLKEKFNINHVKGLLGYSMGGFQILNWASNYPDYTDFIIPTATTFNLGNREKLVKTLNAISKNDEFVMRNDALINFDITNKLNNITAKTLIIAIANDMLFPLKENAILLNQMIKGSKLVKYYSALGHLGLFEIGKVKKELNNFLN